MNSDPESPESFDAEVDEFLAVPRQVDERARRIASELPNRFSEVVGAEGQGKESSGTGRRKSSGLPIGIFSAALAMVVLTLTFLAVRYLIPVLLESGQQEIVEIPPSGPEITVSPGSPVPAPKPEPEAPDPPAATVVRVEDDPASASPSMGMAMHEEVFDDEPWSEEPISPEEELPWSFEPILAVELPESSSSSWPWTDIDRFVVAKYEEHQVSPAPDAELTTLLRRVTYDLTGLPPTPEEVTAFLQAAEREGKREAYQAVVDDLLARQQFGEKWARFWLDLAGYDAGVSNAWRYREYVIAAFNEGKPFHRFVAEQIAGDLLPSANAEQSLEAQIATGFLAMGEANAVEPDLEKYLMDQADRQIDLVTRTFLGLSVACARCHNHKFDPISKYDYYALAGIFRSTETLNGIRHKYQAEDRPEFLELEVDGNVRVPPALLEERERETELKRLQGLVRSLEGRIRRANDRGDGARAARMRTALVSLRKQRDQLASSGSRLWRKRGTPYEAIGVWESPKPANLHLNIRGNVHNLGDEVERGFPDRLEWNAPGIPAESSGRLELAKWLLAEDHPLTARVFVNRIWAQLLGVGIVRTTDDFGANSEPPTHPELLDFLAREFMEDGWSMKQLIRRIVLSRTYQLDVTPTRSNLAADPDNQFLWRRNLRQLTGEELRDTLIHTAGVLTRESAAAQRVKRYFARGEYGARSTFVDASEFPLSSSFRTIYLPIVDSNPGMLATFDCPSPVSGWRTG